MAQLRARFRNDVLWGGNDSDTIIGGAGHDVLYGGGGDDWILGGDGQDTLNGGTGRDTLDGGAGHDALFGGEGEDWLNGGTGNDTLSGGAGNDRLAGGLGNDTTDGGAGDDVIVDDGGNDVIVGGQGNDTITGGGGNDVISGGPGHDVILGGAGNDIVDGGAGNDTIEGRGGQDRLSGGEGDDRVTGGAGSDSIDGGAGNDTLDGRGGDDSLAGGAGHDQLDGGAGSDRVNAGAGNDQGFYAKAANAGAQDSYDGGTGFDTLRVELSGADAANAAVQADLAAYRAFLAANANPARDNGAAFTFTTMDLTARNWEALETVIVNQAPTAQADMAAAAEDGGPVAIDVLANDTDPDAGDIKTLVSVTPSSGASVSIADNRAVYDPGTLFQFLGASATHVDSFRYVMRDAAGATSSATASVTITGRNDAPVAQNDTGAANEDGPAVQIDVLANDTDIDAGDTKTIVSVSGGAAGTTVTTDGARITYNVGSAFQSLNAGQTATDVLTYVMRDAAGATSSASVVVTVTGRNDAPVAQNDTGAATEDGAAVIINVLTNDTDADAGDTKTIVSVSGGAAGTTVITDGARITYNVGSAFQSLNTGQTATDVLTYVMRDAASATSSASVTITINGVTDTSSLSLFTGGNDSIDFNNINSSLYDRSTYYLALGGNDTVRFPYLDLTAFQIGFDLTRAFYAGDGFDRIIGNLYDNRIFGDAGNDSLFGVGGNDTLWGGDGDDSLDGGESTDTLFGDTGKDILFGNNGNDTLLGGGGYDTMRGGIGDDYMDAEADGGLADYSDATHSVFVDLSISGTPQNTYGSGFDTLVNIQDVLGSSINDILRGSGANNSLWGGAGADSLFGGGGDDYLKAESSDVYTAINADLLDGGDGIDTADYRSVGISLTIDLRIQGVAQNTVGAGFDTLIGIENLIGAIEGDTLYGNEANNIIDGGGIVPSSHDKIFGFGGNDIISGSGTIDGGSGDDQLTASDSLWWMSVGGRVVQVAFGSNLQGGAGNDTLFGSQGNDSLAGGTGNDTLWGGQGAQAFSANTFFFRDGDGQDVIGDFGANASNLVDLAGVAGMTSFAVLSTHFSQVDADTVIALNGGDSITLLNVSLSNLQADDFVYSSF